MVRNRFFVLLSFLLVCCVLPAQSRKPSVKPGIEVLRERGFEGLRGKRVGLVTNPSGVDSLVLAGGRRVEYHRSGG